MQPYKHVQYLLLPVVTLQIQYVGQSWVVDFVLHPGGTLGVLRWPMLLLASHVQQAMDRLTDKMPELTKQAADHFNDQLDAWDIASAASNVLLGGVEMGANALGWIVEHAAWSTVAQVVVELLGKWTVVQGAEFVISTTADDLLPDELDEWRRYELPELMKMGAYVEGLKDLSEASAAFEATADDTSVDPGFDFDAARSVIEAQRMQMQRIINDELAGMLVPPDPASPYNTAIFAHARQLWIMNHAFLSLTGGVHNILTGIKIGGAVIAGGATLTGVGLPVGALAGTVATGAAAVDFPVAIATIPQRWVGDSSTP